MRDIAQSVSKVADLEMDNYFKTLLSEKRDIQDQQQQHIPSPSPVKRVPTSAKQPPKLSSSLSPPRLRGLAPGRNYDPRRLDYGSAQKAAGSRSLKTLGGTLKSGKQHWRENSNGGGAQTEREGSRGAGAGSRSYLNEPVYQRLYDTQTIYNQRLEGKKLLRYREQTQEMREKPEISPQSRKMTSSQKLLPIYSEKRIQVVLSQKETKIEKMKDEQARKKLLQEGEVEKLMRHFGVGAGAGAGSPKKQMTQAQWELKVSKLVKVYTERQKRKEEERIRNQSGFSFKPELCSRSVKILEKKGTKREGAVEERLIRTLDQREQKLKCIADSRAPNFIPTLNQNSMRMVDERAKALEPGAPTGVELLTPMQCQEARREQLKWQERILEGTPPAKIEVARLEHDQIIELSPSEEQSDAGGKREVWLQENSLAGVLEDASKRPSSVNSSLGIIEKFKDLLLPK